MSDTITLTGKIGFDPKGHTKKHELQGSWKRVAMVLFDGDITEYYSWFLRKRYSLILNKPLRGAHVTFINDRGSDMTLNGQRTMEDVNKLWNEVRDKWHGKSIDITFSLDPRSNSEHWWLPIPKEHRIQLQEIRNELGLGEPYFSFHMSLGYANEKNIQHSEYIHMSLKTGMIP